MILANTEAHLFQEATFLRINISSLYNYSRGDPVYLKASRITFTLSVFLRLEKSRYDDHYLYSREVILAKTNGHGIHIYTLKKAYIRLFKAFKNKDKHIQRML